MTEEVHEGLTPLDPDYITTSRIATGLFLLPFKIGALVLEIAHLLPYGSIIIPVLILTVYLGWVVPRRKYRHWGYDLGSDRLRIVRGYLFHRDTIVPFGRIQHIDVDQGPIDRKYGLAKLTVHTAGNHNASVTLPGLRHEDAITMRDTIRAHIKRDVI